MCQVLYSRLTEKARYHLNTKLGTAIAAPSFYFARGVCDMNENQEMGLQHRIVAPSMPMQFAEYAEWV